MRRNVETPVGRRAFLGALCLSALGIAGCGRGGSPAGGDASGGGQSATSAPAEEEPKTSSDPHVQYIKNYKGKNAASVGYTALNTFRMDTLGGAYIRLVYVDPTGVFVDPENEDQLKEYVVFDQNLPQNTQVDIVFETDEEGKEYEHVVDWQTHEQVVLAVKKVGEPDPQPVDMTPIDPAPDEYTAFVRDYVGRNLAECGYESLAGKLTDAYGPGYVTLVPASDDGSYIDASVKESLAQYVVVSQDVAPNTQFTMEPTTATNGEVYDLISSQSLETVSLSVRRLEQ